MAIKQDVGSVGSTDGLFVEVKEESDFAFGASEHLKKLLEAYKIDLVSLSRELAKRTRAPKTSTRINHNHLNKAQELLRVKYENPRSRFARLVILVFNVFCSIFAGYLLPEFFDQSISQGNDETYHFVLIILGLTFFLGTILLTTVSFLIKEDA